MSRCSGLWSLVLTCVGSLGELIWLWGPSFSVDVAVALAIVVLEQKRETFRIESGLRISMPAFPTLPTRTSGLEGCITIHAVFIASQRSTVAELGDMPSNGRRDLVMLHQIPGRRHS